MYVKFVCSETRYWLIRLNQMYQFLSYSLSSCSLTVTLCFPSLQSLSARPDPEHRPLLVFLCRDVRALPSVLPLRLPDQHLLLHHPSVHQTQVRLIFTPSKLVQLRGWILLIICISVCYREHPVFLIFMQLAVISIFKSYPTVGDIALYLAFLPVWSHLHRCECIKHEIYYIKNVRTDCFWATPRNWDE